MLTNVLLGKQISLENTDNLIDLYREIAEQTPSSIVITDSDSHIVYVNESFIRHTGYSLKDLKGKNPRILKSGLTPDIIYKKMWDTLMCGKEWYGQFLNKRKDGTLFWEDATIFPIKNEKDSILYYVAIKSNITPFKDLESELYNTKTLLNTALNSLQDIFFAFNEQQQFLRWNSVANKLLGYYDEEIKNMKALDFIFEDDRELFLEDMQKIITNGSNQQVLRIKNKNGQIIPIEFNTSVIKNNKDKIVAFAGIGRDISETYEANLERHRIFDVTGDLICILTDNGCLKDINPSWKSILGWSNEELKAHSFQEFSHPDEKAETDHFLSRLTSGKKVTGFECRFLCKNGSYKTLVWNAVQYPELNVIYAFARDISKERELQQQILHKQKMEAIGTLAGGIAHDFNNILSSITGYSQLIKLHPKQNVTNNVDQVLIAAKRAKELVKQILTFSREQAFSFDKIKLLSLVKEVIKLVKPSMPSGITIMENVQDLDGIILADFSQIHQLVLNILTNAYQSIDSESGTITVSIQKYTVKDQQKETLPLAKGQYIKLAITDTGVGIPMYTIDRIFDPFYSTKENGTGLGLSVVDGIIKNHNGHIEVQSELDKGTTFNVYLPRLPQNGNQLPDGVNVIVKGNAKIVLVDDEKSVMQVINALLKDLGYNVFSFSHPRHALNYIRQNKDVDLLITDFEMPDFNGEQLSKLVKKSNKNIPVILMTGYNESDEIGKISDMGIQALIKKPFTIEELTTIINKIVNKKGKREYEDDPGH